MPKLDFLVLNANPELQLGTLPYSMTSLRHFEVGSCNLTDVRALSRCASVKKLRLFGNPGLRLNTLPQNLSNLRDLDINRCNCTDISELNRFPMLRNFVCLKI